MDCENEKTLSDLPLGVSKMEEVNVPAEEKTDSSQTVSKRDETQVNLNEILDSDLTTEQQPTTKINENIERDADGLMEPESSDICEVAQNLTKKQEPNEKSQLDLQGECSVVEPSSILSNTEKLEIQNNQHENIDISTTVVTTSGEQNDHMDSIKIKTEPTDSDPIQQVPINKDPESFASVRIKAENGLEPRLVGARNFITKSSLGLLAQYDSESEHDEMETGNVPADNEGDVVEVPLEANKDYRNQVVEIDSDSESESSSSDNDIEYIAKIRKEIEKNIDFEEDDDEDDDGEDSMGKNKKKKTQNSMRVKGELGLEDLPPIEDLHITVPEEECVVLGKIHSIVDQLLLVSAIPDSMLYDLDTVLFLEKGKKVLGEVFDVLGQVADPLYCVRFNSNKDIEEKGIKVGDTVYVAPKTKHTQFVILSSLMKMRGSDASWENDVEPPPRYLDYSDDEQEREARQRLRNKDRSANKDYDDHEDATKRAREAENEAEISDSSEVSARTQNTNRGQRGNRQRRGTGQRVQQNTQRYHNGQAGTQNQMQRNANSGSWHSNYNRPYSYNRPPVSMPPMPLPMQLQMQNATPPPYQLFPTYPHFAPPVIPPPAPYSTNMYLPNPYAVRPPQLFQAAPSRPMRARSPSPKPPGVN